MDQIYDFTEKQPEINSKIKFFKKIHDEKNIINPKRNIYWEVIEINLKKKIIILKNNSDKIEIHNYKSDKYFWQSISQEEIETFEKNEQKNKTKTEKLNDQQIFNLYKEKLIHNLI